MPDIIFQPNLHFWVTKLAKLQCLKKGHPWKANYYFRYSAALVSRTFTCCRSCHLEKKNSATLKMFLFQASKMEESVVLVLYILKSKTKIYLMFSFVQLVVFYVRSDISYSRPI